MRKRIETHAASAEDAADQGLPAIPVAEVASEIGRLVRAGGEDDRSREQERETGGFFVVETSKQPGDHRDAGPTDHSEQGADLRYTDRVGLFESERVDASSFFALAARGRVFGDELANCRASMRPFTSQEDDAVHGEKDGGREWLGEQGPERVLEC